MIKKVDVAIVGAGPAGLATAIGAALRGMRVRVVDAARLGPVDKACGEGLLPHALSSLKSLGVHSIRGQRLSGIRFLRTGCVAEARFRGVVGIGVRRTTLHEAMLARASELGIEVEWGTTLTALPEIDARFVVGADGGHSRVRDWAALAQERVTSRRIGLRQHFLVAPWSDFVEVYWGDRVQAYVTPVGEEEVGIAVLSSGKMADIWEGLAQFPELRERLDGAARTSVARGALTLTRRLQRVTASRVALVGDASGSVDAITGEGVALAFRQAEFLVEAMSARELDGYNTAHRKVMRMARFMSGALLWMDRSAGVRLGAMGVLARVPGVFEGLLRVHVGGAEPPFSFASTSSERDTAVSIS